MLKVTKSQQIESAYSFCLALTKAPSRQSLLLQDNRTHVRE